MRNLQALIRILARKLPVWACVLIAIASFYLGVIAGPDGSVSDVELSIAQLLRNWQRFAVTL